MKAWMSSLLKTIAVFIVLWSVMFLATVSLGASFPVAHMPQTVFKAPDTVDGEDIVHDFIIQNSGTGILQIAKGKSACGFTVASVPKPIPPGGKGLVTVRLSTCGSGGSTIKKSLTITTNDPDNKRIPLAIKTRVIKPYTLSSRNVKLNGKLGNCIKETMIISPTDDNPFTIQEVTTKRGQNIHYDLEEIKKWGKDRYKLTVENTATDPGIYFDTLYVKTDSEIKPIISITIIGKIRK